MIKSRFLKTFFLLLMTPAMVLTSGVSLKSAKKVEIFDVESEVSKSNTSKQSENEDTKPNFEIKVLDLNFHSGDSTIITYNDMHILIDAGGTIQNSGDVIYNAIKDFDTLDYVIITHADSDHIANINETPTSALYRWANDPNKERTIGTFIDFDTNNKEKKEIYYKAAGIPPSSNSLIEKYRSFRTRLLYNGKGYKTTNPRGKILNYFTAYECVNKLNGATDFFKFQGKDGLRILNNFFYDTNGVLTNSGAKRNNVSVCCMFEVDGKKHLFTGDLEEFQSTSNVDVEDEFGAKPYDRIYGESLLVAMNYKYLKDGVDFFKAGHHGSNTSNSTFLMDVIRPRYIAVPATAPISSTSPGFRFPKQLALLNMTKWTDYCYINGVYSINSEGKEVPQKFYGDVIYQYNTKTKKENFTSEVLLEGGSSANESLFLTPWYKEYAKMMPYNISILGNEDDSGDGLYYEVPSFSKIPKKSSKDTASEYFEKKVLPVVTTRKYSTQPELENKDTKLNREKNYKTFSPKNSNATYIKLGHIDILINFGEDNSGKSATSQLYNNVKKVAHLCNDHVLDYLIITNYQCNETYNDLLGSKGLLKAGKLIDIKNFYHFGAKNFNFNKGNNATYSELIKNSMLNSTSKWKTSDDLNGKTISIFGSSTSSFHLYFDFLNMPNTQSTVDNPGTTNLRDYSLGFNVVLETNPGTKKAQKVKYTNIGGTVDSELISQIVLDNSNKLKDVDLFELTNHGISHNDDNENVSLSPFVSLLNKMGLNTKLLFNGAFHNDLLNYKVYKDREIYPTGLTNENNSGAKTIGYNGNICINYVFSSERIRNIHIYQRCHMNYFSAKLTDRYFDTGNGKFFVSPNK